MKLGVNWFKRVRPIGGFGNGRNPEVFSTIQFSLCLFILEGRLDRCFIYVLICRVLMSSLVLKMARTSLDVKHLRLYLRKHLFDCQRT